MPSNPSLGWQKIQDVYYCIRTCYESLNWDIDNLYSNYKISVSTNTTLLALASKFVPHPNIIDIYSISGNKVWSIVYNNLPDNHIIDFAFRNEGLCVVLSNQKFRYYQDFKSNFNEYSYTKDLITLDVIGSDSLEATDNGTRQYYITNLESNETEEIFQVLEVHIWGKFLVLRLSNRLIITNLDVFINYEIPFSSFDSSKIHCLKAFKVEDDMLTLLASYDTTIISIKVDIGSNCYEIIDHSLTDGPFTQVAVSPNGLLVALFNPQASTIFVINNEFDQVLLEYDTSNESIVPYQVEWCGNDAIILSLRDEVKLIGPGQQSLSFFYDIVEEEGFDIDLLLKEHTDLSFTIPILKTEEDGLKIITSNKIEFLSRVPDTCIQLYQIGSSHPSSILLDCIDKLSQHSSKAETNISLLKSDNSLLLAMNNCLEASLEEFNQFWQKKILKAVSFGKAYNDEYYNADEYLRIVNLLKVLNQLRSPDIGIFITYKEMIEIGWEELISMLLRRDLHYLALKVVDLLNLHNLKELIYIHWCCYKIKKELNMSDLELFKIIAKRLSSTKVSVDKISKVAYEEGRLNLCKLLINLEPSTSKRINRFLNFEELELALIKSFQTADFDLCKLILLYLQDKLSISQFFKILNQNERKGLITDTSADEIEELNLANDNLFINDDLIGNFWIESLGKGDLKALESFYKQEDKRSELNILRLKGYGHKTNHYESYKSILLKLINYSLNKKSTKLYQRELDVLELQKKLGETYQSDFFSEKSLNAIIIKLIKMNQLKQASKIVKDFKISQEKYWYLVLETYAKLGEFDRLFQFAINSSSDKSNLKSPVGFNPFVETCFAYNGPKDQISTYIANCTNIHYCEKISLFIKNKDLISAANEAFKHKDINILKSIYESANQLGNENIVNLVKGYIIRLGY